MSKMKDLKKETSPQRSLWECIAAYGAGSDEDRRRQIRFAALCLLWALSFVAANRVLKLDDLNGTVGILIAAAPSLFAVYVLFSYISMLNGMDEFMRRVQYEGLAFGFGIGIIFMTGYQLLSQVGAPQWGYKPVVVMMFAWAAGQLLALWRYR
jgi:hypothetical protein